MGERCESVVVIYRLTRQQKNNPALFHTATGAVRRLNSNTTGTHCGAAVGFFVSMGSRYSDFTLDCFKHMLSRNQQLALLVGMALSWVV